MTLLRRTMTVTAAAGRAAAGRAGAPSPAAASFSLFSPAPHMGAVTAVRQHVIARGFSADAGGGRGEPTSQSSRGG
jgi:hypothetical protein